MDEASKRTWALVARALSRQQPSQNVLDAAAADARRDMLAWEERQIAEFRNQLDEREDF